MTEKKKKIVYSTGFNLTHGCEGIRPDKYIISHGEVEADATSKAHGQEHVRITSRAGDEILVQGRKEIRCLIVALEEALSFLDEN